MSFKSPNKCRWQAQILQELKTVVREKLRLLTGTDRLDEILRQVRAGQATTSPRGQMETLVWCMSALVHHEREGGLKRKQLKDLKELALSLMQLGGVQPKDSRLAFCFSELYLVLSQIQRKEGNHWAALWEQQLATYLGGKSIDDDKPYYRIGLGIRILRYGHGEQAIRTLDRALDQKMPVRLRSRGLLEKVTAARLVGNLKLAQTTLDEVEKLPGLGEEAHREFLWQSHCLSYQEGGDLRSLLKGVRPKTPCYLPQFLLQAHLWRFSQSRQVTTPLASVRNIPRIHGVTLRDSPLFQAGCTLENCYDSETPLVSRLQELGTQLQSAHLLVSLEDELLLWAGAARWLARNHHSTLASLCLSEYESRCLRLSGGANPDTLTVARDLLQKPWHGSLQAA